MKMRFLAFFLTLCLMFTMVPAPVFAVTFDGQDGVGAGEVISTVADEDPTEEPSEDASEPSEAASFSLLREQLMDVLDTLTPREKKVLELRFGLADGRTRTLEEVGKEFNVTRERIRQIESKALRKLRHPSRSKKLKDFIEM